MALKGTGRARIRVLLIVAVVAAGMAALLWWLDRRSTSELRQSAEHAEETPRPLSTSPTPAPAATPAGSVTNVSDIPNAPGAESSAFPEKNSPSNDLAVNIVVTPNLIIPVAGVKSSQLLDTFADARSEGRMHDALDIPAPQGTAVLAAADGEIVKLFQSERGGTTIYVLSTDKQLAYYYAHLERYADGLVVGKFVRQGEVIAYVGDTGNAGAGNFHLHFSISVVAGPKRYWEGTNINPYPLLHK